MDRIQSFFLLCGSFAFLFLVYQQLLPNDIITLAGVMGQPWPTVAGIAITTFSTILFIQAQMPVVCKVVAYSVPSLLALAMVLYAGVLVVLLFNCTPDERKTLMDTMWSGWSGLARRFFTLRWPSTTDKA